MMTIQEYRGTIVRAELAVRDLPRFLRRAALPVILAHMLKESEQQAIVMRHKGILEKAKAGKV